jgi:polar amino acid transport system substrate-binding protein
LLAQKVGLDYKFVIKSTWMEVLKDIKFKKGDVTIATSETEDRKKYAIFTKSYMKFPLALVCRKDVKENNLYKLKIGVGKDFTAEKLMKKYYPKINLIEEKNAIEALKNVENSNLDCVVDILPTVVWLVNKENFLNLKLFKKLPIEFKLQIMIRKDLVKLRDRLNEAIDKITPEEKNKIINKYIGFIQEKDQNRILFTQIAVFVLVVFVIFLVYEYFKVKKIANYDKLTQIYNRNALSKYLKELLKNRGSIIFFDIDHFKNINDTYGHEKGDFVLKELAKIIKENLRKNDIFGRWGGEEFLILLPNTSYEETLKVAEKLRKII